MKSDLFTAGNLLGLPGPVIEVFIGILLIVSPNFLYDPYRQDRRNIQEAKKHIRKIEKAAGKEIRKKEKIREKEEKNALKR